MGRPSNKDQRRQQIVEAMISVMARRGYEAASISRIAGVAGLTPGLVHYHFKSKQEILLALLERLVAGHAEVLDRLMAAAEATPAARLQAFIRCHLGLGASADPEAMACWVLLSGEALRQDEVREALGAALQRLADLLQQVIQQGMDSGDFQCERADVPASALLATIQGYFVLAATRRELIPRGSAARAALAMAGGLLGVALDGGAR